jgi:hypothetical protein
MAAEGDFRSRTLDADSVERLASELSGAELHSLLLHVMERRAARRAPRDLIEQFGRDLFCAPSPVDLRLAVELDAHLLGAAESFEALELSPVAPLGTCSVVAPTSQKRVLSATRSAEVVSDPTNVLALECALRLRRDRTAEFHLATSQRVLRTQPFPRREGMTQHFRMFALASAGRERQGHGFTVSTLLLHIRTMLFALERLEQHRYAFGLRRVDVLAAPGRESIAQRVAESLGVAAAVRPLEHAYYSGGLRYMLWVTGADGAELPLIDGGVFDWLQKLTSDRRAVFVASGAGAQLMALRFRTGTAG